MPLLVVALTLPLQKDVRELAVVACTFFPPLVKTKEYEQLYNCKIAIYTFVMWLWFENI